MLVPWNSRLRPVLPGRLLATIGRRDARRCDPRVASGHGQCAEATRAVRSPDGSDRTAEVGRSLLRRSRRRDGLLLP